MQPGQIAGEVVTLVDHGARSTAGHVRQSLDTGRRAARHRALQLHRDLERRELRR
jgi:hypothetical protein